ncbi:MAG: DUF6527 family protein [Candidatus Bathyarchaeota archaeon]|nr:DUF6527 family protein [Candidatus Bathyarchaeota archaeon]
MKRKTIKHKFVELMPDDIKEGILYISIPFATAIHRCPCGCGELIVTPIKPTDWSLNWNGKTITLYPSIGNWTLSCKSHYWIIRNQIYWASSWSNYRIQANREYDRKKKQQYYGKKRY